MNEVSKREIGRQRYCRPRTSIGSRAVPCVGVWTQLAMARCMVRGCTHFMPLNCDEFYASDQLQRVKEKVISGLKQPLQFPLLPN